MPHQTIHRKTSGQLAFDLEPPMLVSAMVLYISGQGRPIWAVGHPTLELFETISGATEILPAQPSDSEGVSMSPGSFVEFGVRMDTDAVLLDGFSIGVTPPGMQVFVPAHEGFAEPGRELVIVLVGERTGFLRFTI